jgi:hypothetical protein
LRKNFCRVRLADKLRSHCPSSTNYGTPCGPRTFSLVLSRRYFYQVYLSEEQ